MRNQNILTTILGAAVLALTTTACNLPQTQANPSADPEAHATDESTHSPNSDPVSDPTDEQGNTAPTPTNPPTPEMPPGWEEYTSAELGLTLHYPEGWTPVLYDSYRLDLFEDEGYSWIEVGIIDETSDDERNLEYTPGMQAEDLLTLLVEAAREDGEFTDARSLKTRSGQTFWVSEGFYELMDETILIGILGLQERAILVVAHGGEETNSWSILLPLYETFMWSVEPL